jgi:predicted nucleotidyltransferase
MSDISNRLFTKLAKPVDAATASVLRSVDRVAMRLGYPYFLVGATARHLMLVHALGLPPGRTTRDIDFGLATQDWEHFGVFKETLGL